MFELFVLFGFWFWFLVAICFIAVVGFIEFENFFGATCVVFVCVVLLYFGGNLQVFKDLFLYIKTNPMITISYVIGYIFIGVVWSFIKYYFFLINFKDKYNDKKKEWFNIYPAGTKGTGTQAESWEEYSSRTYEFNKDKVKPNMEKILLWMIWWIPSMVWTLINDPIKKMFRYIYYRVVGVYETMHKRIVGNI